MGLHSHNDSLAQPEPLQPRTWHPFFVTPSPPCLNRSHRPPLSLSPTILHCFHLVTQPCVYHQQYLSRLNQPELLLWRLQPYQISRLFHSHFPTEFSHTPHHISHSNQITKTLPILQLNNYGPLSNIHKLKKLVTEYNFHSTLLLEGELLQRYETPNFPRFTVVGHYEPLRKWRPSHSRS